MSEQRNPINITIKCQIAGFGCDVTAECLVDHIPGLVAKLRAAGVEPAHTPYVLGVIGGNATAGSTTPCCPIHKVVMKESKHKAGEFYCSAPIGLKADGSKAYCDQKVGA